MATVRELTLQRGNRMMLIVAVIAGLVAAVAVFVAINQGDDNGGSASTGTVPAVVAAQNISIGTEITEGMVKLTDVPEDLKVSGALSQTDLAIGEVARVAIASGEQITSGKLGVPVPDKGLAGVVPVGMRAVSFEVGEVTAVGGLLLPGDRVDILAAFSIDNAAGVGEGQELLRVETILQNVEVLSVAQEAQDAAGRSSSSDKEDASGTSGQLPDDVEEQPNAGTITVALSPVDAARLISVQEYADRVWSVLRAYGDSSTVDYPPVEVIISDRNN